MISQTARRYQLEKRHFLGGEIVHGDDRAKFKYVLGANRSSRAAVIHGFAASDNTVEIETVDIAFVHNSDVVILADGKKYTVASFDTAVIDENQLRTLPWDKADKVYKISLKSVG